MIQARHPAALSAVLSILALVACGADSQKGSSSETNGGVAAGSTVSCKGGVCAGASPTDGVKNGDESDVDCGGTQAGAARCAVGQTCNAHADCVDGCGETSKRCVAGKSCTKQQGGSTCGAGEDASGSCCEQAPLADTGKKIDKYYVTAGRMRAMVERLGGDVRSFVKTLPSATWDTGWNDLVPSTTAEANTMLGPYWPDAPNDPNGGPSKYSCQTGDYTGHTYWTPDDGSMLTQSQLDSKSLNCVGWHLAQAFCAWEGGRLPTSDEIHEAFTNGWSSRYPWGDGSPAGGDTEVKDPKNPKQDPRMNHAWSYRFPASGSDRDAATHISAPGRFPLGYNDDGVADLAGNLLPWVSDSGRSGPTETGFVWTFSWESHGLWWNNTSWGGDQNPNEPNGYYAIGFRCVHD